MKWENYGESSLTLLAVYSGMDKESPATPRDPSDFIRCIHLFECLGLDNQDKKKLLYMTAGKYSIWIPFADEWELLMELYHEEKDLGTAPKLKTLLEKKKGVD